MPNDHENGDAGGRIEYLDHTADAMFRAYGRTLEECFAAAAHALCGLMWVPEEIAPAESYPVDVTGIDLPQLLVAFLEEILFRLDAEGFLTREAADLKIERPESKPAFRLTAVLRGDLLEPAGPPPDPSIAPEDSRITDPPRYSTHGDVKAVTYNQIRVERDPDNRHWMVQAVVDM